MATFRVTLRGRGIRATFDGAEIACGFFKNEFVWAKDRAAAIAKARARVAAALRDQAAVNQSSLEGAEIDLEEVEAGLALPNLLRRQGFVFHKLDSD